MDPVRYTVTLADRGGHRFHVRVELPSGVEEVVFPSWAPGSYLMREFARFVRGIHAHREGAAVPVRRASRNRWQVTGPATLEYDVYGRDKTVRTAFLDESLAFFLPSNLLVYAPGQRACALAVEVPEGHTAVCPLGEASPGPVASWTAPDLDTLMDSPVAVGRWDSAHFEALGVPHEHYVEPGHNADLGRMATDLQRLCRTAAGLFGEQFPYDRYQFITIHVKSGHGGLEHKTSSVLLRPRLGFVEAKGWEEFITLAAHEHFHAWNVKRIHPEELGPRFDYANEHYTRDLWWLEGGTVYYEERVAFLSGCIGRDRYLARLAENVHRLRQTPGRRHQSLEDGSFDAWIKLYRASEDLGNSAVSYYLKGGVVVMCLDLELRHRTGGEFGTDEVLRRLWQGWGRHGVGYPTGELERICRDIAKGDGDFERWFAAHVRGTDEVAVEAALDHAGIDLVAVPGKPGGWLGVELSGLAVSAVREDGPSASILSPGDELLALDDERLDASGLGDRLRDLGAGRGVRLLLSRDGRVIERALQLASTPNSELKFTVRAATDPRRARVRESWLSAIKSPGA